MNRPAATSGGTRLSLRGVRRGFDQGGVHLDVLRGIDLEVGAGEMVALVGPSGSGKSTLLHIAGLLERPSSGTVAIEGRPCDGMNDADRTALRRSAIGFVYQFHHLLPDFSAVENVILPQMIAGQPRKVARVRAEALLGQMGLSGRLGHRPSQLSGGEQQRVAIVRALANEPTLLLADEPTGNLDHTTADEVFDMLVALVRETGVGALVATHNPDLADRMDRTLELRDGVLVAQGPPQQAPAPVTATRG